MLKHFTLALIASVAALICRAQNLVPNPSFEEYLECPFSTGELDNQVVDWYSWQQSPDFFHVCSSDLNGFASIPENAWGFQWPISGNSYTGVFTFVSYAENGREYMAAPLTVNLEVGTSYYMMFYVSLCDSSEELTRKCATNNLGMRFFKDPEYSYFPPVSAFHPDNFAHLNSSFVITDDQNWTLIEGWFTSDDSYNWVALGNFFDDQNTTTVELNVEQRCSSIYYIENVCVATDPSHCEYLLGTKSHSTSNVVKAYPNPATTVLNVDSHSSNLQQITLHDQIGRVLINQVFFGTKSTAIDVSAISKGIYILSVKFNSEIINQKIIIQ